ncbi:MAG: AAA family ATPase [Chitinophagaceae bacterium]|nr:AAA family ATPase [Chitinophagaceae bacterium]
MKIKSLKISNVLSFKYHNNLTEATEIAFDSDLNILIGQNGSGKSTVLEVINFIFKRVIFKQYYFNEGIYEQRKDQSEGNLKQIFTFGENATYSEFRLNPNWNYENQNQTLQIRIELDSIDIKNLQILNGNKEILSQTLAKYSNLKLDSVDIYQKEYLIEIHLDKKKGEFTFSFDKEDGGTNYLKQYNLYKEIINLYNRENQESPINNLF